MLYDFPMKARRDLTGMRFGRWEVLGFAGRTGATDYRYRCRCSCGREKDVSSGHLTGGKSLSCGCLRGEQIGAHVRTHGRSKSAEYTAWQSMRSRCNNPRVPYWNNYGGRGIRVCDRWNESFAAFYADIGPRPSAEHSIDRIDNDGHYEPGNCRWSTRLEQAQNTRRKRAVMRYAGRDWLARDFNKKTGLPQHTFYRCYREGLSLSAALARFRATR